MASVDEYKSLLLSTVVRGDIAPDDAKVMLSPVFKSIDDMRPRKLYRYRTCNENNFDALLNDRVYFNIPRNFNDPHDCLSFVDNEKICKMIEQESDLDSLSKIMTDMRQSTYLIKESFSPNILPAMRAVYSLVKSMTDEQFAQQINELQFKSGDLRNVLSEVQTIKEYCHAQNEKLMRDETYIACMSENIDSTLMWAHYADYHKGFALEYDTDDLMVLSGKCQSCKGRCIAQHTLGLYPVVYSNDRFDATEYEIETLKIYLSNYFYGIKQPLCIPDQLFYIKANSFKGMDWEYEKEWRVVYNCMPSHPASKYEVLRPKAVYLGSQMTDGNKGILKKLIEGKDLTAYEMYVDANNERYVLNHRISS